MTKLEKRLKRANSADYIATRFNPMLTYVSKESTIDILQQRGASNRKHYILEKAKTYKRFANQ